MRLALVSCPVALYSARHERGSIKFNMINPKTGNRIKMVTQDAETGEPLSRGDTVKGYEYTKGRYLVLTDEDFDSVKVESSAIMAIEKFVDADSIDPVYYDASYYLAPDGRAGDDVYAVLREAVSRTGKVALTRVVIAQRERTLALRPGGAGLIAQTLNEERDLNPAQPLFEGLDRIKVDPEMVKLATELIQRQAGRYDPSDLEDRYETRLRAMLDAKTNGQGVQPEAEPAYDDTNVVDLMAALRKSLGEAPKRADPPAAKRAGKAKPVEDVRSQPGLKLPIQGGKAKRAPVATPAPESVPETARRRRKA